MYTIGRFAALTSVTVKALYLYERHGLIAPRRTAAGYRRYTRRDMARLNRILALKSLGLSLKQIALVTRNSAAAAAVFAEQRRQLADERERADRAVRALDLIASDAEPAAALERFVGESGWARAEAKRQAMAAPIARAPDRVGASKLELFRELQAALDRGSHEAAVPLVARWDEMLASEVGDDVDLQQSMRSAWANWKTWPEGMKQYVASLYATEPAAFERVAAFIERHR